MSVTSVGPGLRDMPRQRHLSLVRAEAGGRAAKAVSGPPAARPEVVDGRLRLTRRGRVIVALLGWCAVALVVGLFVVLATLVLGGEADAGDGAAPRVAATEHVVLPGETLWQIASDWSPQEDPREAIARLVEFNALPGVQLVAGQTLLLPEQP